MGLDRDVLVKVIRVCQNKADSLDYRCDYNRVFNDFRLISSRSAAYVTGGLGRGFAGSRSDKVILFRSYTKGKCGRPSLQGSQSNFRSAARERYGHTTISSVRN